MDRKRKRERNRERELSYRTPNPPNWAVPHKAYTTSSSNTKLRTQRELPYQHLNTDDPRGKKNGMNDKRDGVACIITFMSKQPQPEPQAIYCAILTRLRYYLGTSRSYHACTFLFCNRICADCVAIAFTAADIDARRSAVDAVAPLPPATLAAPEPGGRGKGRAFTGATFALVSGRLYTGFRLKARDGPHKGNCNETDEHGG